MPTYHYKCENCSNDFEQYQSIKDDTLTLCNECGMHTLYRVIHNTDCFVENITTIGQQRDKNTKLMGQNEVQERYLKDKSQKIPLNASKVDMSLAKLTKEQQQHYIMTGQKPITTNTRGK